MVLFFGSLQGFREHMEPEQYGGQSSPNTNSNPLLHLSTTVFAVLCGPLLHAQGQGKTTTFSICPFLSSGCICYQSVCCWNVMILKNSIVFPVWYFSNSSIRFTMCKPCFDCTGMLHGLVLVVWDQIGTTRLNPHIPERQGHLDLWCHRARLVSTPPCGHSYL